MNSNLVVVPCHLAGVRGADGGPVPGTKSRHPSTLTTTTITTDTSSPQCAKAYSSSSYFYPGGARFSKDADGRTSPSATADVVAAAAAAAVAQHHQDKDTSSNVFSSLYDRLCRWMAAAGVGGAGGRRGTSGDTSRTPRTTPRSLSRSSSVASTQSADLYQLLGAGVGETACLHASLSSDDSELGSLHAVGSGYSSTCSSLTLTSSSTTCSGGGDWTQATSNTDSSFPPSAISTGYFNPAPASPPPALHYQGTHSSKGARCRTQFLSVGSKGLPHTNLTFTISCPLKTKRQSISGPPDQRDRSTLCATWPPTGRKTYVHGKPILRFCISSKLTLGL